jgi:hypothetical protein
VIQIVVDINLSPAWVAVFTKHQIRAVHGSGARSELQRFGIGTQGPLARQDDPVTGRIAPDALEEGITLCPRPLIEAVIEE